MTAETDLLPCPFCGGQATLTISGNVRSTRKCMVKCSGCRYQRIDAALRYGDDWLRATAIAAWNRRANLAELQREVEGLRAEVERLRRDRDDCLAARKYYASLYGEQHGRAERLAKAAEKVLVAASARNVLAMFQAAEALGAALHPTAAQENDDA